MHYSKHFLSRVSFQLNFEIEQLKKSLHDDVAEVCKELTGADKTEVPLLGMIVSMSGGQINSSEKIASYLFDGRRFRIQIQYNFIHISDMEYSTHGEFHSCICSVFDKFNAIYGRPNYSRVALRYINNINFAEGNAFNFTNRINSALLNPTLDYTDFGLTRSIGIMNMKDENDIYVNFTYGFINSQFPNKIAKREFLLDYDCYKVLDEGISDIQRPLLELRNKVNILFNKAAGDELKELMRPQP